MNTKIIYIIMVLFVAATVCPAQNTYAPTSLRQWDPTFWNNDVFADTVPEFVLMCTLGTDTTVRQYLTV